MTDEKKNEQPLDEQISYWTKVLVETFGLTPKNNTKDIADALQGQFVDRSANAKQVRGTDKESSEILRGWKKMISAASMPTRKSMHLYYAPKCYSMDDPITLLYESNYNLILFLLTAMMENDEIVEKFLDGMMENGVNAENADALLTNEYSVLAHLQQMPLIAEAQRENPAIEDFNTELPENHRLTDAKRKIQHTYHGQPVELVSLETGGEPDENGDPTPLEIPDADSDFAEQIAAEMTFRQVMSQLTEKEQTVLKLRLQNKTLDEIAKATGYHDASGVKKVLKRIGERIREEGLL